MIPDRPSGPWIPRPRFKGRNEEVAALTGILRAIDVVRRDDGTSVPLRGAGAPPQRVDDQPGHDQESAS